MVLVELVVRVALVVLVFYSTLRCLPASTCSTYSTSTLPTCVDLPTYTYLLDAPTSTNFYLPTLPTQPAPPTYSTYSTSTTHLLYLLDLLYLLGGP